MFSVCLPSDALLQHLPSYLGFSYLGRGLSLHSHSSLPWMGYLLTAAPPDFEHGVAPLGPPAPVQPPFLGHGVAPPSSRPWPQVEGSSSWLLLRCHSLALSAAAPDLRRGVQQHVNRELPDVQAGFRKIRGTRDQIANICYTTEKTKEFKKKDLLH